MQPDSIQPDSIPEYLKSLPQWIVWRTEERNGKLTKVPYSIYGGKARSDDPATWADYNTVIEHYTHNGHDLDGIGFVFARDDGIVGIDLDHCTDERGNLLPWAREIVDAINSYTEWSPSGEGLHIILKGKLPGGGRRRGNIEMYDQRRYFTMTGRLLDDSSPAIEERQEELEIIRKRIFSKGRDQERATSAPPRPAGIDDAELLRRAMRATNGEKFARLWVGNTSDYPSQSEADFALCRMLAFWTGGDTAQMDRLFRQSGLYRDKWDTRHYSDGRTYGQGTIENALATTTEFYTPSCDDRGDNATAATKVITAGVSPGVSPSEQTKRNKHRIPEPSVETVPITTMINALKKSETGDAELLAMMYRDRVVFDHTEREWYVWNGAHWQIDRTGNVSNLVAYQIAGQYLHAAGELQKSGAADDAAAMTKRAGSLRRRNSISNVLARAESQPNIALTGEEWDANPWLLGVANGVVDLRDGSFSAGNPRHYIRKAAPTPWLGMDTPAPRWERFLSEIFAGDEDLINFVQRLLGYGITGLAIEHIFPVLWGDGRNGKGTLLETIGAVLGNDLASPTEASTLMMASRGGGGGPQPFVYALRGTRIIWASETNEGQVMNIGLVKRLTGGDTITCRTLHSKPVTFAPTYLILLLTNNKPHVTAEDPAIWDRLRLIPFTERFVADPKADHEHPQDKYLAQTLRTEGPGILAWLVRGCLEWQQTGLHAPASVTEETDSYRREEDILGQFLSECTVQIDGERVYGSDMYRAYSTWCEENGITPRSNTVFGKKIKRFYLTDARDMHGVYYKDIALRTQD